MEEEAGEWECVLRGVVEVVGTAHKGTAIPPGIYEAALSLQGDEQSFFFLLAAAAVAHLYLPNNTTLLFSCAGKPLL